MWKGKLWEQEEEGQRSGRLPERIDTDRKFSGKYPDNPGLVWTPRAKVEILSMAQFNDLILEGRGEAACCDFSKERFPLE